MTIFRRKPKNRKTVGLALSGGGMRGFAHLGALKAFEEHGISFDIVVGTSAGSLVGALYSLGLKADDLIEAASTLKVSDFKSPLPFVPVEAERVGKFFTSIVGNLRFEDCEKKFAAVACDLVTGKQVILESGYLGDAISASCAVPLFFKPVILGERHLVDGGLLNNIPSQTARLLGAQEVVAVDINSTRGNGTQSVKLLDVLSASFRIMLAAASGDGLKNSSVLIAPDMQDFSSFSKEGWERMVEHGYTAALQQIEQINKLFLAD